MDVFWPNIERWCVYTLSILFSFFYSTSFFLTIGDLVSAMKKKLEREAMEQEIDE